MPSRRLALANVVLVSSVLATTALATPATMAASSPAPTGAPVPREAVAAGDDVTFTAVLPYDAQELRRVARKISTPGNKRFRSFLTVSEAAAQVGASSKARRALKDRASDLGITAVMDATGLTAQLTAPESVWTSIYGEEFLYVYAAPAGAISAYLPEKDNQSMYAQDVPAALRGVVSKIFPIDTKIVPQASSAMDRPINEGTPFGPGAECLDDTTLPYTYSPNQLHVPYGTTDLHDRGMQGKGTNLAIIGVGETFSEGMAEEAGACFDYRAAPINFVGGPGIGSEPIYGGPGTGIESNLDVQASGAVLPAADAVTFVETVSSLSFIQNLIQGYTTALAKVHPDVITLSYGACVAALKESGDWPARKYLDDLFAFSGIVGTSVLVAAGDSGSSGCLHGGGTDASLQADYPAASPWATAVGGSRIILGQDNERVNEVVWNSTTWSPGTLAGGGGSPTPYPSPWYQGSVSNADRRMVPDFVAHAAISPGWPVAMTAEQFESFAGYPPSGGATWGMGSVGGTSAASPFTAANFALLAAKKGRLGFLNPWLYSLVKKDVRPAFFDIVDGNNQVDPEPACCAAVRGYDMASGLGAPEFDELLKLVD
jgi:subtilase family serine protease